MRTIFAEPTGSARRAPVTFLAVSLLLFIVTAACGQDKDVTGDSLDGSSWEMTSVWDGHELIAANPTSIVTAVFADGTATGYDGCNFYTFPFSVASGSLSFGELAITGRTCPPTGFEPQGDEFIRALQASARFDLSNDSLELSDAGGAVQVRFRPARVLPLENVTWQLEGYAGTEGGTLSPLTDTQISLAFRTDGTLTGIAGCNSYSAPYQIDGGSLAIGEVTQTAISCPEPDGVMAQERTYLGALQQAVAFTTSLTGLALLDTEGNLAAQYRFGGRVR